MIRTVVVILSFFSVIFLPWAITVVLSLAGAFSVPLLPLSIGLFADVLYWSSGASSLPLYTILGSLATTAAFFVRGRLRTSSIKG